MRTCDFITVTLCRNKHPISNPPEQSGGLVLRTTEIEVEGVSDYHGDKENWYIP